LADFELPDPDEILGTKQQTTKLPDPDELLKDLPPREERAKLNLTKREIDMKKRSIDLWIKNMFGQGEHPGITDLYLESAPPQQKEIREFMEEKPARSMTPGFVPLQAQGVMKFDPESSKMRFEKLFEQQAPPPSWKPGQPPKPFGKEDIVMDPTTPTIGQGPEEKWTAGGGHETFYDVVPEGGKSVLKQVNVPGKGGKPFPVPLAASPSMQEALEPAYNLFVDLPFRTLGGAATGVYRGVRDASWEKGLETFADSVTDKDPKYLMTLGLEIGKDALGRDLTIGESILFGGVGLVAEFILGPKMYPKFGKGAMTPNVEKQIGRTMKKIGASRKVALNKDAIRAIINESKTFPEMVAKVESEVVNMAKAAQVDPEEAVRMLRRVMGPHHKHMGKEMARWMGVKVQHPAARKAVPEVTPEQISMIEKGKGLKEFERVSGNMPDQIAKQLIANKSSGLEIPGEMAPLGGRQTQWFPGSREVAGKLSWGRGTPRGVREAMREAQAPTMAGETLAEQGRGTEFVLGGEEASKRITKSLDLQEFGMRTERRKDPLRKAYLEVTKEQRGLQGQMDEIARKEAAYRNKLAKLEGYQSKTREEARVKETWEALRKKRLVLMEALEGKQGGKTTFYSQFSEEELTSRLEQVRKEINAVSDKLNEIRKTPDHLWADVAITGPGKGGVYTHPLQELTPRGIPIRGQVTTSPKSFWHEIGHKAWIEKDFKNTPIGVAFRREYQNLIERISGKYGGGKVKAVSLKEARRRTSVATTDEAMQASDLPYGDVSRSGYEGFVPGGGLVPVRPKGQYPSGKVGKDMIRKDIPAHAIVPTETFANVFKKAIAGKGSSNFPKTTAAIREWAAKELPSATEFARNAMAGKPITEIKKTMGKLESLAKEGRVPSILEYNKYESARKKITKIADEMDAGFQKALKRAGLTEDDIAKNLGALTEDKVLAIGRVRQQLDIRFGEMVAEGIDVKYLDGIIPHIETKASKALQLKGGAGAKATKHALHRDPVQAGVAIGGTPARQFEQRLGTIYSQYMMGTSVTLANARAENIILQGYGKLITKNMLDKAGRNLKVELRDLSRSQGLAIYEAKIGHFKGQKFLIDAQTARFLEKTTNPDSIKEFIRAASWYTNWWKARATIVRPGFMVRNVMVGNLYQEWLADVDIIKSNVLAAKAQMYLRSENAAWYGKKLSPRFLGRLRKPGGGPKIGPYTFEEACELVKQYGIRGGGMYGAELTGAVESTGGVARGLNPFSRSNYLMRGVKKLNVMGEDNARIATFFDALAKGYSPQEAAARVAKYIFNYNELTTFGEAARQVMPFWTWTSKNWGLQLATLLKDMGKTATASRMLVGLWGLDEMTPEEELMLMHGGEWLFESGAVPIPGMRFDPETGDQKWAFGEPPGKAKGSRGYVMTANLLPVTSALQGLSPKMALQTLGDMLHPLLKILIEQGGYAPSIHFGVPFTRSHESRRLAPGWSKWLMSAAREMGVDKELEPMFRPVYDPAEYMRYLSSQKEMEKYDPELAKGYHPGAMSIEPLGYTWPSWVEYALHSVDPGLATFSRMFKQNQDAETYNEIISTTLGWKIFEYGPKQVLREDLRTQYEIQDYIMEFIMNRLKHGNWFKKGNPNYTLFPNK
jgi:hypothetical protein